MTSAAEEMPPWSRRRWWVTILSVLLLQAVLVFLLEDRTPVPLRQFKNLPVIRLRENVLFDSLAVSDPTLFVLPHQRGFSGEAWLNKIPARDFQPREWTEPPRWLGLSANTLGTDFKDFITANAAPDFQTIATLEPDSSAPELFPIEIVVAASTLRAAGALAHRRLLAAPELPVWARPDLLASSVVQLLVDASGKTLSTVLLTGSGDNEVDQDALRLARAARFEPASSVAGHELTVGTLTFEWQTQLLPATNAPPASP